MRNFRKIKIILSIIVCGILSKILFDHIHMIQVQSQSHTAYEMDRNYAFYLNGVKRNIKSGVQNMSMHNDNTHRIFMDSANRRPSDTAYFMYLHGLSESLTVIARSIVYYDDRPDLPDTPCLRFYFVYQVSITDEFWNSLR